MVLLVVIGSPNPMLFRIGGRHEGAALNPGVEPITPVQHFAAGLRVFGPTADPAKTLQSPNTGLQVISGLRRVEVGILWASSVTGRIGINGTHYAVLLPEVPYDGQQIAPQFLHN